VRTVGQPERSALDVFDMSAALSQEGPRSGPGTRQSVAEVVSHGQGASLRGSRLPSPTKSLSLNGNSHRPSARGSLTPDEVRGQASISELVGEIEQRTRQQEVQQSVWSGEVHMMDTSDSPSRSPLASMHMQPQEPSVDLATGQMRPEDAASPEATQSSLEREYEQDPYLARMRANVAALGEVTRRLRASAFLDDDDETPAPNDYSRSILLDSERSQLGLGDLTAGTDRDLSSVELEVAHSKDKLARSLIESGSLQFRRVAAAGQHALPGGSPSAPPSAASSGDRPADGADPSLGTAAAAARRHGADMGGFARFTMVLNHEFESLVPADRRAREVLKVHLAESLAAAARVAVPRVKVLQLRAGSVIVDLSIRPDPEGADWRSPDEILHQLHLQVLSLSHRMLSCALSSHVSCSRVTSPPFPSHPI
jgi:hypothetical protein